MTERKTKSLKTHFIVVAGYNDDLYKEQCRSMFLEGMKKCDIKKVMVTFISMWRRKLITKEKMENYCKGIKDEKESVNDDLESFFEDIRHGEEPDDRVWSYFFPKLTEKEMKLIDRKDQDYLKTFLRSNPDVEKAEMLASESNSKFVQAFCLRKTFTIENPSNENETS